MSGWSQKRISGLLTGDGTAHVGAAAIATTGGSAIAFRGDIFRRGMHMYKMVMLAHPSQSGARGP